MATMYIETLVYCFAISCILVRCESIESQHNVDDKVNASINHEPSLSQLSISCDRGTKMEDCVFSHAFIISREFEYQFGSGKAQPTEKKRIVFSSSTMKWIPNQLLDSFPNVEILYLENLQTEAIKSDVFRNGTRIKRLYLGNNNIETLDDDVFDDLHAMELISLDENRLVGLPPTLFQQARKLKTLTIAGNNLERIEDGTFHFTIELAFVNISHNKVNFFKFALIPSLLDIDVSFNKLKEVTVSQRLQYMNASYNHIGIVTGFSRKLRVLDLTSNNIHQTRWVQQFPELVELYLSHNQLREIESEPFLQLNHLQILLLHNNQLFAVDPSMNLPMLRVFDLSHNNLVNLDNMVHHLNKLESLSLDHNSLVTITPRVKNDQICISLAYNDWDCANLWTLSSALPQTAIKDRDGNCPAPYEDVRGICCRQNAATPYLERLLEINKESRKCEVDESLFQNETKGTSSASYQEQRNEILSLHARVSEINKLHRNIVNEFETTNIIKFNNTSMKHAEYWSHSISFLKQRNKLKNDQTSDRLSELENKRLQISELEREIVALQAVLIKKINVSTNLSTTNDVIKPSNQ